MTETLIEQEATSVIEYPSEDGEPLAETYDHLYAILMTLAVLTQYLSGRQATVLADQFLYYSQGFPRMRVAPDVMVIFNVAPGGRDNYKIWEEGEVPTVIFEMTSPATRARDLGFKKDLYEQLGVQEYWLFDPKGEWIPEKLRGYHLDNGEYVLTEESYSTALELRLAVEDKLISFYRTDTAEKLLLPAELYQVWEQEQERAEQERERAEQERERAEQERERAEQAQERAERARERAEQERERAEQAQERAERARERAEQERERAEQERERADALAAQLRALGVEPESDRQ